MQFKTLLLLPGLVASTTATITVAFEGFYYPSCAVPSIIAANIISGACGPVQNLPITSFSAHVYSGTCEDSTTSPVLKLYIATGCTEDSLYGEYELSSEDACFEVDGTFLSNEVVCQ
ncbi:hypothetical protein BJX99DRAFT_221947 [Aspergillus californicus]